MKLVIIAGGKGTRLGLKDIPKPMVKLNGKPLLEHQILLAKRYGIKDIYILSGHLSKIIIDYFQDGSSWGVNIKHIVEDKPLGTAGALKQLENELKEKFLVFYGDTIMDLNLEKFIRYEEDKTNAIGVIIVHPNDHPHDSDLLEIDDDKKIVAFHSKPHKKCIYYSNLVNAALYLFSPKIFKYIEKGKMSDFGKDIFPEVIQNESIYGYKTTEYLKDMGTPERLDKVEQDLLNGKVAKLNKSYKQKAVFLDRDGVINEEVDNLSNINEFKLILGVSDAIRLLNKSDYIVIVVTNQPVIAKGFITIKELGDIHKKMDTLLGEKEAYVDDLYYCRHHPEKGFVGEIEELKIDCDCRKPKSGMLIQASNDYNIDLSNSWMIGDRFADIAAGDNVKCKTVLLKTGHAGKDKNKFAINPNFEFDDLQNAVEYILKEK